MVLPRPRSLQIDHLVARPWLVVLSLTLLTIAVADVVRVVLLEFLAVDVVLPRELLLPESQ